MVGIVRTNGLILASHSERRIKQDRGAMKHENWTMRQSGAWMVLSSRRWGRPTWAKVLAIGLAGLSLFVPVAGWAQTTDPRTLLRDLKTVQFREDGLPLNETGKAVPDEEPPREMLPSASPESLFSPDTQANPPTKSGESEKSSSRKGILGRLPFFGGRSRGEQATPVKRPAVEAATSEVPVGTPPVLLPPPDELPTQDRVLSSTLAAPQGVPHGSAAQLQEPRIAGTVSATVTPREGSPEAMNPMGAEARPGPSAGGSLMIRKPSENTPSQALPAPTRAVPSPRESGTEAELRNRSEVSAAATAPVASVPVSSAEQHAPAPRLQPSDFALPNERIEPREEVRFAYIEAIALAREGKSAAAAQKLRLFARTYPSSPLAPRAIFLAALLSEDPQVAEQDVRTLQRFFPTSDYLTELKLRGLSVADDVPAKSAQLASSTWETSSSAPIRQLNQVRDRVEELMRDKRYVEALSVLEQIPNGQGIPDVLDLQAQCYLGLGDNRTALAMIAQLLENFPSYERRQAIRLSYGLLLEDASQYERARAEYRKILEEAPDSDEARAARARLEQLNTLTE
ncbi:MAG: hypothetical protein D6691_06515 [Candidatus Hydrogenedentota bacterium]|uniref:Uncharacterized protein n=1 Tax=Sumerlaea chitinivorans TaxID=2250252 RepID=A0A2Z4Y2P4_SUMC1|nr:hypothetical protein BRCON_0341 [Candidatus Sumerlaea chitinivorans]RMH27239.1 MAG: hypothetical protein D6691_06515 [Candidatus Hydrogenedentota bacterium]